ncbi:MAG TPA: O-antigen ligase family protein [Anaerolineaceae bacterium]|nr:O-antigen ligase family protein [Anaerolineaceae bacterium]
MASKLSRFCEGLIEASWLAAVILIPLFFNNYTSRIFEPDKAALLRSLALVAMIAWVVKLIDQGLQWNGLRSTGEEKPSLGSHLGNLLRVPLLVPAFGIAFSYILSTVLSVVPNDSWGGSYYRLQGLYTTLAYLALFAALIGNLRQRSQLNRLVSAVILTSLPIIIYALLQRFELEPLIITRRENEWQRVTSNLGAPVFLAAYLILIFPVTVMRLVQSVSAFVKKQGSRLLNGLLAGAYFLLAGSQLITVLLTGSRGAFLGLALGVFAFFILLSIYWRKRWPVIVVSAIGVALFAFLFLLGIPNGPFQSLMQSQTLGNTFTRFAQIFSENGDSARFRIVTWQIADNVFSNTQPLEYIDGHFDSLGAFRQVVGYGPETQWAVSARFYTADLTRTAGRYLLTDRYHNELWDVLVTTGGLGLVMQMAFYALLMYLALRWLGVVATRRMQYLFWGLYFGLGLAGAAFLMWRQGANFGWMGYMFGTALGVLVYLVLVALFARFEKLSLNLPMPYALLVMASLAAVMAHWIELSVSFTIVSTGMLVYVFAGLIVVGGYILPRMEKQPGVPLESQPEAAPAQLPTRAMPASAKQAATSARGRRRGESAPAQVQRASRAGGSFWSTQRAEIGINAFIVTLIVSTLGYIFLQVSPVASVFRIIGDSLFRVHGATTSSWPALFLMTLLSWLGGCLILSWENYKDATQRASVWLKPLGWTVLVSGIASLVFWFIQAGGLVSLIQQVQNQSSDLIARVTAFENFLGMYYLFVFVLLIGSGWLLTQPWPRRLNSVRSLSGAAAAVGIVLTVVLVVFTNLRPIQADSAVAAMQPFLEQGQFSSAIKPYERMIDMAPAVDNYYNLTGKVYLGSAASATNANDLEQLMILSEQKFKQGLKVNPMNAEYLSALGTLYSNWASNSNDQVRRAELAQYGDQAFAQAVRFNPQDADVWNKWAYLQMGLLDQPEQALQSVQRALEIKPFSDMSYAILGDYYAGKARNAQGEERIQAYTLAAQNYEQALNYDPSRAVYWLALGNAYSEIGEYQKAIDAFSRGRSGYPTSEVWKIDRVLASLYMQTGQKQAALAAIQSALQTAPEAGRADLEAIQAAINAMP